MLMSMNLPCHHPSGQRHTISLTRFLLTPVNLSDTGKQLMAWGDNTVGPRISPRQYHGFHPAHSTDVDKARFQSDQNTSSLRLAFINFIVALAQRILLTKWMILRSGLSVRSTCDCLS